jgi:aminoglycoside 6'-N-acetyltransferase
VELKGKRVSIRPIAWDDLPILCRWWNDPVVMREVRVERYKPTLEDVQKLWPVWQNPGPKDFHMFVICRAGRTIGEIGYRITGPDGRTLSVDIKIGEPSLWGQGLGTEALELFVSYIFDCLPAHNIKADVGDWNQRSLRLFEKCGFKEIGREYSPPAGFFDGGVAVLMQRQKTG